MSVAILPLGDICFINQHW